MSTAYDLDKLDDQAREILRLKADIKRVESPEYEIWMDAIMTVKIRAAALSAAVAPDSRSTLGAMDVLHQLRDSVKAEARAWKTYIEEYP